MSANHIGSGEKNHENISKNLEAFTFNSIRKVLPDKAVNSACDKVGYKYRHRVITPIVTVLHMILSAIWPEESFAAGWEVLWTSFSSRFGEAAGGSPSLGSVAKARNRLPLKLWKNLFAWVSQQAQKLSQPYDKWKGHRVVLIDGTCISMADKQELTEEFGKPTGYHGTGRYPLAKLVALCIADTMTVLDYALGRYDDDENYLAKPLLKKLQKGDLLLADRHFAGAHFYWYYNSLGVEFLTRVHQRLKISRIRRIISYGENDFIGWLKISPVYLRKNPELPAKIKVRFIRIRIRNRGQWKTTWFVTSLMDEKAYASSAIAELYGKRWRIETLFRQVKINLSADVLRSQSVEGVRKEVAARLIAVNVVRIIMVEAAIEKEVDPMRISFVHAVRTILMFSPSFAIEPLWRLPQIYKTMLAEIATHLVCERPGRNEPRAVTRERKHYPKLKCTREQWRSA